MTQSHQFQLFDTVQLTETIALSGFTNAAMPASVAPVGTSGTIVEVFNGGEAYLVELFGGWVKAEAGELISADATEPLAFRETVGVETVTPRQIRLVHTSADQTRAELMAILDHLPDELIAEVKDFAEFLQHKQQQL
ncbi:DUF2281 domain-containing protein [Leptolyngbya sp. NK1-12]|uniref:DUF2281 domain-containing protein n=1 Tax=Leptolyngbya sp. NK1-12 TaxID=2547451 RepID=A0AA97AQ11_9CYAN|nr:DUF2281 domain-containing protein [Leptolyngbya sp. NK1-12]WNZ22653.1 DUF2281 domain-containing protein [Leptolyngbya sp. NK1-12]